MTDDSFDDLIRREASADHRAAVRGAMWRRIFGEDEPPPTTGPGDADGGKGDEPDDQPLEIAGDERGTPFRPIDLNSKGTTP